MVEVATGGLGTKALRKDYPFEDGLTAGTTTQKDHTPLEPTEEDYSGIQS